MRKIVYYVAASLDGFISGPNGDISGFVGEGSGVDKYLKDLAGFDTVIMGRKTYEFGYSYDLQPGQPAYPHMKHYIFSNTLQFENTHEKVEVCKPDIEIVRKLKREKGTDIYLCGGGELAGWLLDNEEIDILKIKLNPLILGDGIRLFGNSKKRIITELLETETYENGLQMMRYRLV
jgi:dihydrofolate reductase